MALQIPLTDGTKAERVTISNGERKEDLEKMEPEKWAEYFIKKEIKRLSTLTRKQSPLEARDAGTSLQ